MKFCKFSDPDYQNVVDALVNRSNMDLKQRDRIWTRPMLRGSARLQIITENGHFACRARSSAT